MENIEIWNQNELFNIYKSMLVNYGKTSIPKHHKKQLGKKLLTELNKFGLIK